jgi:hypothetical protein
VYLDPQARLDLPVPRARQAHQDLASPVPQGQQAPLAGRDLEALQDPPELQVRVSLDLQDPPALAVLRALLDLQAPLAWQVQPDPPEQQVLRVSAARRVRLALVVRRADPDPRVHQA